MSYVNNPDSGRDGENRRVGGLAWLAAGVYTARMLFWRAVVKSDAPTNGDAAAYAGIATHVSGAPFALTDSDPDSQEPIVSISAKDYTGTPQAAPARINTLADALANDKHLLAGIFSHLFNGTTWDRQRGNVEGTLLTLAARTADQASTDQINYNGRGVQIYIKTTAIGAAPSVVPKVQGKDPVSGDYYDLLAGVAITAAGNVTLTVYPGITAAANVAASMGLPRTWRLFMDHSNADSITYSAGYALLV